MTSLQDLSITNYEAIKRILEGIKTKERNPRYSLYVGAGLSREAGIKTANEICDDIFRAQLALKDQFTVRSATSPEAAQEQVIEHLSWKNLQKRYARCMEVAYPTLPDRVEYFRSLLQGKDPSFAHHALALLITNRIVKNTCLTTNFDKLLEKAFFQQSDRDCMAIRTIDEFEYWVNEPDRVFVTKIHGDYDTENIRNTISETLMTDPKISQKLEDILENSGLVVLGTAAFESSVSMLFTQLIARRATNRRLLRYGISWGVHMGTTQPDNLSEEEIKQALAKKIEEAVSPAIVDLFKSAASPDLYLRFFPIWGAGNFLLDLIRQTPDSQLKGYALLYLDHDMRLRNTFAEAHYPEEAIDKHINRLNEKREQYRALAELESRKPEEAFRAIHATSQAEIRIIYGDITSRSVMDRAEFRSRERAVVSPDDTFLSVGGGVAEILIHKAGRHTILNEIRKFGRLRHCDIAVTSGGRLPVHYIFHAAATEIEQDGSYSVSPDGIYETTTTILRTAAALEVDAIWIPLLASGVANLDPKDSMEAILTAFVDWQQTHPSPMLFMIYIFSESLIDRGEARNLLGQTVTSDYAIERNNSA